MGSFDFDDNASTCSLAITTDEERGRKGGGGPANNNRVHQASDHSSNYDGDRNYYLDGDKDSPQGRVQQKMARTKVIFLVCLLLGGAFLAAAAYLTACQSAGLHAAVVGIIFAVQLIVFLRYEYLVTKRGVMLLDTALQNRQIVNQLFPNFARDRLMQHHQQQHVLRGQSSHATSSEGDIIHDPGANSTDWQTLTKLNTLKNQHMASASASGGAGGAAAAAVVAKSLNSRAPTQVRSFLSSGMAGIAGTNTAFLGVVGDADPIAELFPHTTVFFADIAGFTAWSSERDPPHIFRLLERVYGAFDSLADALRVFKVETIGDSYMCVTGLPEPDELHAVNMARFAYQCLVQMQAVTEELKDLLGPGTEDLHVRIGLHSGPVTAGVLRGQKSRFQLFGDTVNTASRMESTGAKGRIHVSESTANLLEAAGKGHWIQERVDRIVAKGRGEMRTFWLEPRRRTESHGSDGVSEHGLVSLIGGGKNFFESSTESEIPTSGESITLENMSRRLKSSYRNLSEEKHSRLIDFNTNVLLKFICAVIQNRGGLSSSKTSSSSRDVDHDAETLELPPPFESVADVILLPEFDRNQILQRDSYNVDNTIDMESLRGDIRAYVAEIAALYQDVPFHNFEHASHVTLAVSKLLLRMTSSDHTDLELHLITYGISSDPLTQLAMVLAALIHDVGHSGITNSQLVAEESSVAFTYKEQSVAEQNSLCVAWALLLSAKHKRLRSHIYRTNVERKRFRQVIINAVMATDIADRNVIVDRARKWHLALQEEEEEEWDMVGVGGFGGRGGGGGGRKIAVAQSRDERNRRATVVIESLMQVADLAHTMQHITIYRRWNEYLFEEMYAAYMDGRSSFDPTAIWFKGELAFFDHFVIPLARKIDESGIFGASGGDQYLNLALSNRNHWENHGQDELTTMIARARTIDEPDMISIDSRKPADYSRDHAYSRSRSKSGEVYDHSSRSRSDRPGSNGTNNQMVPPRDDDDDDDDEPLDDYDESSSTVYCTGFAAGAPQGISECCDDGSSSFAGSSRLMILPTSSMESHLCYGSNKSSSYFVEDQDHKDSNKGEEHRNGNPVLEEHPLQTPTKEGLHKNRLAETSFFQSSLLASSPSSSLPVRDEPVEAAPSASGASSTDDPQDFAIRRVSL